MKPRDPVSENMAFLNGKPTKAFIYQDHDAHIAVHMALMQDPLMAAQIGQNPQAQKMMSEIQAHIAEHLAFSYRKKVEEQLGVPMPAPDENLPQDVEVQLSRLVAQAAQQLLAQSKGQAAQQQAQQQQQDPLVQMQQAELKIKEQDTQIKAQKVQGDLAIRQAELQLRAQEQAGRAGEDPAVAAAKIEQEMAQAMQVHQLEMAQRQQEFEQKMAQKRDEAAMNTRIKLMDITNKPVA
jgi:hypothetical protein